MDKFYSWTPEHANAFVTIISVSVGFAAYWFIALSEDIKDGFFKTYKDEQAWMMYVVFQKMTGVLCMGIIPGAILLSTSEYTLADLGMRFGNYLESVFYGGVICLLIFTINFFASRNPLNL